MNFEQTLSNQKNYSPIDASRRYADRKLCMTSGCGVGRLNWVKGEEDDPQPICAQTVIASSTFQLT